MTFNIICQSLKAPSKVSDDLSRSQEIFIYFVSIVFQVEDYRK